MDKDTIVAVATAPGRGSVGIIRVSGPHSFSIGKAISKIDRPKPRYAYFGSFHLSTSTVIDQGITLFFKSPYSFTGQDVVEFQGHGGPVVLDLLLKECLKYGARLAKAGEFSQRAFLNDKIDLTQAEAISDLINASTEQTVKQAAASLQGSFSERIEQLTDSIVHLRMYVEAAIDFPEEEIDFLTDPTIERQLTDILARVDHIQSTANQGRILQEGVTVVIAGKPNAGKSSLLNALADKDIAIVTDTQGTTRDVIKQSILIDGLPIILSDTAGLRDTDNTIENLGIDRAWQEIRSADMILLVLDATDPSQHENGEWPELFNDSQLKDKLVIVHNKCDLNPIKKTDAIVVSALTHQGLNQLKQRIKRKAGVEHISEGLVSARRRHLDALQRARSCLQNGQAALRDTAAGELLAEELRLAQNHLNEITGKFTSDDLLSAIFSDFCIGK